MLQLSIPRRDHCIRGLLCKWGPRAIGAREVLPLGKRMRPESYTERNSSSLKNKLTGIDVLV
jgi:hypothetical protein